MHIYRIQKNGIDNLICKAEIETQKQRTKCADNKWGVGGEMNWEAGIYTTNTTYKIDN